MALIPLVTVPDDGAVGVVSAALADAGIRADVRPVRPDHPYQASALARPFQISVEQDDLAEARKVLARIEHEMAEEVEAQAAASAIEASTGGGEVSLESFDPGRTRFSWALALGFLVPFTVVCFYARAFRAGALFLGLFLVALGYSFTGGVWEVQVLGGPAPVSGPFDTDGVGWKEGWRRGRAAFVLASGAKAGDLAVGLATIARRRRRPRTVG
jgi:hypothetical protein